MVRVLLLEHVLLDLAECVARDLADDENLLRNLVAGEVAPRRCSSSAPRRSFARSPASSTTATTASPKSWCGMPITADSAMLSNAFDRILDLLRIDVEPAGDDELRTSAEHDDVPARVARAEIAGDEEPVAA